MKYSRELNCSNLFSIDYRFKDNIPHTNWVDDNIICSTRLYGLVDNFHLKYPSKPGLLQPWNTFIPLPRLCFSAVTPLQKKKKFIMMMMSLYIHFGVQFPLHWLLTCIPLCSFCCNLILIFQKQSLLQNLYTSSTVSIAVIKYLYSCFFNCHHSQPFSTHRKRKWYST